MKRSGKILTLLLAISCTLGMLRMFPLSARADGKADEIAVTELNQVMTAIADCDAKEFPDNEAASVISYSAGSPVWVVGETQDGWYKVSYQGKKGFLPKENITDLQIEDEEKGTVGLDEAGLDTELAAMEAESEMLIEEVERARGEEKRSKAWMIVIVLLVIGIFATGIIATVVGKKKGR